MKHLSGGILLAVLTLTLMNSSCAPPGNLHFPTWSLIPTEATSTSPASTAIQTEALTTPTVDPVALGTATPVASPSPTDPPAPPAEVPVQVIPLAGPLKSSDAQVSGLAWLGETLVILPQYPGRYPGAASAASLFTLPKSDILDYLEGAIRGPLVPDQIPFDESGVPEQIQGFEGFEAIAFSADHIFLTIEARRSGIWTGYLVGGSVGADGSPIKLDAESLIPLAPPVHLINKSDEALVVAGDQILSLFEANGSTVNANPVAHVFNQETLALHQIPLLNVEYRITDAAPADENGQFWALNIFWPGEIMLLPLEDPIANRFGEGPSHAESGRVERLLQFEFNGSSVELVDRAPIQLELEPRAETRNWEGLAALDNRGFLIMTDEFPTTILAFIPWP